MTPRLGKHWPYQLFEALILLTLAICIAQLPPVLKLYARLASSWGSVTLAPAKTPLAASLVKAARAQIGTVYDARYLEIQYPGGDVHSTRGACSDVIVRALRAAGADLQELIQQDRRSTPSAYPAIAAPDPNIDHRRAVNQIAFLQRHAQQLSTATHLSDFANWEPGDLVYWRFPDGRLHAGIISDKVSAQDQPCVIHNASVCLEENCFTNWPIIAHFRWQAQRPIESKPNVEAARGIPSL